MEVAQMKAERRTALGRNQVQGLRKEGWMPAVIYGDGQEPVSIQISEWELEQHLKSRHKVYSLDVGGTPVSVYLQEVAFKAINDRPLHADFVRIDFDKPIETVLEVTLLGHPAGLSKGGTLVKDNLKVKVSGLPSALPDSLEVNIGPLNNGDFLRAKDLQLVEGVELCVNPEMAICHVAAPSAGKLAKAAADEAAADGAGGDAGGDGGDGGGDGGEG